MRTRLSLWMVVVLVLVGAGSWGQTGAHPGARLYASKDAPLSSNGSPSVVVFDKVLFDTGGFWSASAPDVVKVPAGLEGTYLVTAGILAKRGMIDSALWMDVRRGPVFFQVCGQSGRFDHLGFTPMVAMLSCSGTVKLAAGETLWLTAYGMGPVGELLGWLPMVGGSIDLTYLSLVKLD